MPRSFYERSPEIVARALLGKLIVRRLAGQRLVGRITETEAYLGEADPASHAYRGQSPRNAVLFGPPGRTYVYLIYGLHYCLNFSCHSKGRAGGVLIRALEPMEGISRMAVHRGLPTVRSARQLAGGPGRLCQAFQITRSRDHDIDVTRPSSTIRVVDDGRAAGKVVVTARIGLSKAVDLPLRFVLTPRKALR
ncbi:MAG TPA: DNA-3-methyladenine glycosylase [Steroidobacteraceae bacterium]|nr:DNA-3-methyladenine glycosylase [Steroidobacteraceae bacterium]